MWCSYWNIIVPTKSPAEVMAEQWLVVLPMGCDFYARFDCIRFHRWWLLLACCLVQFCAGSIYAFTMVADSLDVYFYGTSGANKQSSRVLLLAYIFLGVVSAICGPFVERNGPRPAMALGTLLVFVGYVISQFSITYKVYFLLLVGFGILLGSGYGLVLIVSISTVQKWFPDIRGYASGLCILFFAIGNGAFITVSSKLLGQSVGALRTIITGNGVEDLFWVIGTFVVVVLLFCTLVLRTPPVTYSVNGKDIHGVPMHLAPNPDHVQDEYLNVGMTFVNYDVIQREMDGTDGYYFQQVKAMTLLQCLASTDFICLYVAFAANIVPILVFLPQIRQIAIIIIGLRTQTEVYHFFLYTYIGNLGGRFMSPVLSDLIIRIFYANPAFARKTVFVALLILQCVVLVLLPYYMHNPQVFQYLAATLTSASGGGLALMPCFITDMFGVYNTGTMYGIIWTSWSLGAVISGALLSNFAFTVQGVTDQLHWMLILVCVGTGLMFFVRTNSMDRFFDGYQITACGKPLVQVSFHNLTRDTIEEDDEASIATPTTIPKDGFVLWNHQVDGKLYDLGV
ncbi:hypothetical protein AC1031_010294 [Aphanomyces cochlioides]|nr:hypothetical protein AC1031_010294 [Aphanomyces cochlioides]